MGSADVVLAKSEVSSIAVWCWARTPERPAGHICIELEAGSLVTIEASRSQSRPDGGRITTQTLSNIALIAIAGSQLMAEPKPDGEGPVADVYTFIVSRQAHKAMRAEVARLRRQDVRYSYRPQGEQMNCAVFASRVLLSGGVKLPDHGPFRRQYLPQILSVALGRMHANGECNHKLMMLDATHCTWVESEPPLGRRRSIPSEETP